MNEANKNADLLSAELTPPPDATSTARPWRGIAVNWHDWRSGGHVHSPALPHDVLAMRTSGAARLTQMRDGRTHTAFVVAGNMSLHPRGMESRWTWDQPGAIMLARIPQGLLRDAAEATLHAAPAQTALQNCFGRRDPFAERTMLLLLDELRAPPHPAQAYIAQALSHALAAHLVHRFNSAGVRLQPVPGGLQPRALQRIEDYVHAHLDQSISLDTLANLANVSRFHFARMFRDGAGVSAMAYVEEIRMKRAQELIAATELPLSQVAARVGYQDPSYFTKRFRLCFGCTPSDYARALRRRPGRQE